MKYIDLFFSIIEIYQSFTKKSPPLKKEELDYVPPEPKKVYKRSAKSDLFENCETPQEIKKRFRRLAHLNHPDKGGNVAAMHEILKQYDKSIQKKPKKSR